jgi:anti-sigma B factor antagonist
MRPQTFTLDQRRVGAVAILTLAGSLRLGYRESSSGFQVSDVVKQLVAEGTQHIAINLANLSETPDSGGLGELLAAEAVLRRAGGDLVLVGVPPQLRSIIEMMKLESLFRTAETEDEALARFANE